jgi:putative MFS transporter
MMALVPALGLAAGVVAVPCVASMLLILFLGHETHGRDLRELESAEPALELSSGD